jgi:hypothetical protein
MSTRSAVRGYLVLGAVLVVLALFVSSVVSALFWGWPAYTYQFGTPVVAAYDEGDCRASSQSRRSRESVTTCAATWLVEGEARSGAVTDSLAVNLPPPPNEVAARAFGDRARTTMTGRPEYFAGLAGPAVLLLFVSAGVVGWCTGWLRPGAEPPGRRPSRG